ncbi:ATP-dependent Lhr-like helicase [Bradyrhizobium macuxiense]|uniref:ATP-dependent Lhr-like helicase n=1 Tax=Bradyrhizobium macuxiense TaxID=1755647 RepID=A0A560L857_9BRAD|nr:ATP-dependent Lhr-like helicase [Bradyrhizobium macuxiense]
MSSPASASGLESAYHRLHPKIRRWIRDQGWDELREIQARTIMEVLDGDRDILIAATTAAGKTEAAFLPILTSIADRKASGFSVLYVSPLKALINDQFRRLEELCESMEIPVVRWHGDAPQADKKKAMSKPDGIALITPESIEAMFVRRPADAKRLLSAADFIVVDELHSFLQGPRGLHVASLLRRIDAMAARPARRVGLSATIGDLGQARAWLRPADPDRVAELLAKSDAPELRLQVRGYVEPLDLDDPDHAEGGTGSEQDLPRRIALDSISDHLFETLRGENNLVFGGSRRTVESTADRLRRRSEKLNVPNEFYPHHGSLSKVLREELEDRLKDGRLPTTAVCTSTLELGVDIGSVKSVAQIGAPRSLASLRQRLGRTGRRRGTPSVLRIYLREPNIDQKSGILDRLRPNTIRSVAVVRLLLQGFVEEAGTSPEIASTLIHQILSVIVERGGIRPKPLYDLLSGPGPFASIAPADFANLLRHLGSRDVRFVEQAEDGTLMLGQEGEKTAQSRNFFAVFESGEEWRLTVGGRTLGTLPITYPVHKDEVREKSLAGAVVADHEPDGGSAVGDAVDVAQQGSDLRGSADLDMRKTYSRNDARAQRLDDRIPFLRLYRLRSLAHVVVSLSSANRGRSCGAMTISSPSSKRGSSKRSKDQSFIRSSAPSGRSFIARARSSNSTFGMDPFSSISSSSSVCGPSRPSKDAPFAAEATGVSTVEGAGSSSKMFASSSETTAVSR